MKSLIVALRFCAVACAVPALLHAGFGLLAERWLDPSLPVSISSLASLDSQNRFYGVAFGAYAVLLWMGATDLPRYAPMLRTLFVIFFVAGLARLVSLALLGWPSWPIMGLLIVELLLPPVMMLWLARAMKTAG